MTAEHRANPTTRLGRFLARRPADRRLLAEAAVQLLVARARILAAALRHVRPDLGTLAVMSPEALTPEAEATVRRVGWAVQAAARHVPWNAVCLPQAMAAKVMLDRRGIASTLYLGVARDAEARLKAHAWLRAGPLIVTGREGMQQYRPIAHFS